MSDREIRELQRQSALGDLGAAAALLRARERRGDLGQEERDILCNRLHPNPTLTAKHIRMKLERLAWAELYARAGRAETYQMVDNNRAVIDEACVDLANWLRFRSKLRGRTVKELASSVEALNIQRSGKYRYSESMIRRALEIGVVEGLVRRPRGRPLKFYSRFDARHWDSDEGEELIDTVLRDRAQRRRRPFRTLRYNTRHSGYSYGVRKRVITRFHRAAKRMRELLAVGVSMPVPPDPCEEDLLDYCGAC